MSRMKGRKDLNENINDQALLNPNPDPDPEPNPNPDPDPNPDPNPNPNPNPNLQAWEDAHRLAWEARHARLRAMRHLSAARQAA